MIEIINSINLSLSNNNFYSALSMALIIPDIAGKIDSPLVGSQRRSIDWYDKYILKYYSSVREEPIMENGKFKLDPNGRHIMVEKNSVFLSGNDCYALRCSFLHEWSGDITEQRARETLSRFEIVGNVRKTIFIHMNYIAQFDGRNAILQIDVADFCQDMIRGYTEWMGDIGEDEEKLLKIKNMVSIRLI